MAGQYYFNLFTVHFHDGTGQIGSSKAAEHFSEKLTGIHLTKLTAFLPGDLSLGSIVTVSELFRL